MNLKYIKERVWTKLQGWKEKLVLSRKTGVTKSGGLDYPNFCHELFQVADGALQ